MATNRWDEEAKKSRLEFLKYIGNAGAEIPILRDKQGQPLISERLTQQRTSPRGFTGLSLMDLKGQAQAQTNVTQGERLKNFRTNVAPQSGRWAVDQRRRLYDWDPKSVTPAERRKFAQEIAFEQQAKREAKAREQWYQDVDKMSQTRIAEKEAELATKLKGDLAKEAAKAEAEKIARAETHANEMARLNAQGLVVGEPNFYEKAYVSTKAELQKKWLEATITANQKEREQKLKAVIDYANKMGLKKTISGNGVTTFGEITPGSYKAALEESMSLFEIGKAMPTADTLATQAGVVPPAGQPAGQPQAGAQGAQGAGAGGITERQMKAIQGLKRINSDPKLKAKLTPQEIFDLEKAAGIRE